MRTVWRRFSVAMGAAVLSSLLLTLSARSVSLEQRVISMQLAEASPELPIALAGESQEIQEIVLGYSDDRVLQLKAEVALARYPRMARDVLSLYGTDQAFKGALRSFGEVVLLPIAYYLKNDSLSLSLARRAEETGDLIKDKARQLANTVKRYADLSRNSAAPDPIEPAAARVPLEVMQTEPQKNTQENLATPVRISPEERGQYAIALIERNGYNFLGQFVLDEDGEPKRVYTEAALEDVGSFFAGGIRTLELKAKADQAITAGDVGWAAVDALAFVGAAKLPRLARALAVSEKGASVATRGAELGSRAIRIVRTTKFGRPAVLLLGGYAVVTHPGMAAAAVSAVLVRALRLPEQLGTFFGWVIVLLPALLLLSFLARFAITPLIWVLTVSIRILSRMQRGAGFARGR